MGGGAVFKCGLCLSFFTYRYTSVLDSLHDNLHEMESHTKRERMFRARSCLGRPNHIASRAPTPTEKSHAPRPKSSLSLRRRISARRSRSLVDGTSKTACRSRAASVRSRIIAHTEYDKRCARRLAG